MMSNPVQRSRVLCINRDPKNLIAHYSLFLETNFKIWKFIYQRVDDLKTNPSLLSLRGFGGKLEVNFPQKKGRNVSYLLSTSALKASKS